MITDAFLVFWASYFRPLLTIYGCYELFANKRKAYGIVFLIFDIIVYITTVILIGISA